MFLKRAVFLSRGMARKAVRRVVAEAGLPGKQNRTTSVGQAESLAAKAANPQLGIEWLEFPIAMGKVDRVFGRNSYVYF